MQTLNVQQSYNQMAQDKDVSRRRASVEVEAAQRSIERSKERGMKLGAGGASGADLAYNNRNSTLAIAQTRSGTSAQLLG